MRRRDFIKVTIAMNAALAALSCGIKSDKKIKVVMLGFDGANWPTIDPLIKKGKLPFLKKFKEESAWAYFKTFAPAKSNVVWTSIATGKTMMKHGILDFAYLRRSGMKVPYSKSERKEPTLWQILDTYNKRSVAINWWVSHPPDEIKGIVLSDHFRRIATCRPEKMMDFAEAVHPRYYFDKLKKFVQENNDYQKVLKRTGLPDFINEFQQMYPEINYDEIPVLNHYSRFAMHDGIVETVSDYLFNNVNFDFFATYLRFPDIVQHFVTHLMDKEFKHGLKEAFRTNTITQSILDEAVERISNILEPVYQYMERIIEKYVNNKKHKNTYFFIMSDHGFSLYPGGFNHYNLPAGYPVPDGFLLIHGPEVKKGMIKKASVFDLAPTILNLYDLPVGKNMDGRVLKEIFTFNRKIKYKPYTLKKDRKMKRDKSYDKESLEELKSIGYI